MRKLAVDTVSQLVYKPFRLNKYYKLKAKKGELLKKKFRLFPYPHIEKIFAEDDIFYYDFDLTMHLMTKEELKIYDSDIDVIDNKVYYKPKVIIIFLDKSSEEWVFDNQKDAFDRYNELKIKLNLKEIEE